VTRPVGGILRRERATTPAIAVVATEPEAPIIQTASLPTPSLGKTGDRMERPGIVRPLDSCAYYNAPGQGVSREKPAAARFHQEL